MFRASNRGRSPAPPLLLVVVLILAVSGCGGGGQRDRVPAFERDSLAGKIYEQNLPIHGETLPAATGGDGVLTYSITPDLPAGLTFDPATRELSGTPSEAQAAILYTYRATDSDAANPDSASLVFEITVNEDPVPVFETDSIAGKVYEQNLPIDSETLPAATGGDGVLTYAITPDLPAGLAFDGATRLLSGTPSEAQAATLYTYTATDSDALHPDSASLEFRITVKEDPVPVFETSSIANQSHDRGVAIDGVTLPGAHGGNGLLTYTLSPELPAGLVFDAATRRLSGTPTLAQAATRYTYTATDSDPIGPDSVSLTFHITVEAVASVSIVAAAEEVDEGDDLTPIHLTLTLSEAVTGEVFVALASTGTARLGSDFDLADTAITFAEGETQATATITPIRDLEAEPDEFIALEISGVAGRAE
ncbi:MAG: putative Ig domain-containing protein, partial [Candidatus Tectomicrobia bacterium]|nr:putative Ig domain-containing protein [Candidatus Tectomicrobia bacterium]